MLLSVRNKKKEFLIKRNRNDKIFWNNKNMNEEEISDWKLRLQSQIEYYFSDKNLKNDKYIRSKLNSEEQFPIIELVHFPKIQVCSIVIEINRKCLKRQRLI